MVRRNANKRRRPVRHVTRIVNRQAHGMRITPPTDPPAFIAGPWWPMTVVMLCRSDTQALPKDVAIALLAQLSWDAHVNKDKLQIPIELRFISIRSWGTGKLPHQLTIFDALGTKSRIAEMNDYGSNMNYSRNGWKFGSLTTNDAVEVSDNNLIFTITGASDSNKVLVYVQLLFRTTNSPKPVLNMLQDAKRSGALTLEGMEL